MNVKTGELTLKNWKTRIQAGGKDDKLKLESLSDDEYLACVGSFSKTSAEWFEAQSKPGGEKGKAMEAALEKAEKAAVTKEAKSSRQAALLGEAGVAPSWANCAKDFEFEISTYPEIMKSVKKKVQGGPPSSLKNLKRDSEGRYFMPLGIFFQNIKIKVLTRLLGNSIEEWVGKHLAKILKAANKLPGFKKVYNGILKTVAKAMKVKVEPSVGMLLGMGLKALATIPTLKLWVETHALHKQGKTKKDRVQRSESAFRHYQIAKFYPLRQSEMKSWDEWKGPMGLVRGQKGTRFEGAHFKMGFYVANFKKASQDVSVKNLKFHNRVECISSGTLKDQTKILLFKKQANLCIKSIVVDAFDSLKRYMSEFEKLKKKLSGFMKMITKPIDAFMKLAKAAEKKVKAVKKAAERATKAAERKVKAVKKAAERKAKAVKKAAGKAGKAVKKVVKKPKFGGRRRKKWRL
jgi:hypothetical protein